MLTFAYPWLAVLLPLPLLAWWLLPPLAEAGAALRVPFFGRLVVAQRRSSRGPAPWSAGAAAGAAPP